MRRAEWLSRVPLVALVAVGAAVGGLVVLVPGFACMVTVLVAVGLALNRWSDPADRRFLLRLYAAAIGARMLIGGFLHVWAIYHGLGWARLGQESFDVFGDSAWTSLQAWLNTQVWLGQLERYTTDTSLFGLLDHERYSYLYAVFYWLFGFSQFAVKLIGSLWGAMTALVSYAIVKDLANRQAAVVAAVLVAFFPSTLLWSLSNLKDAPNSLGVTWACWAALQCIRRGFRVKFLLHLIGAVGFVHLVRPSLSLVVSFGILLGFVWSLLWRPARRLLPGLVVILALAAFYVVPKKTGIEPARYWRQKVESALGQLAGMQSGQTYSGGSSYVLYPERFYEYNDSPIPPTLSDVASAFVKGWGYFLLAPVPWAITTLLQVLAVPEMILWYVLLVFAVMGASRLMREIPVEGGALLIWIFVLSSVNALTTGNVGVAFRHRSLVIPLYLVLSAIGLLPMRERMRRNHAVAVPVV